MSKIKFLLSIITLALVISVGMATFAFASEMPATPTMDNFEGSIGQTYVKIDGTKVKYFNGQVINSNNRATSTVYNGYVFDHDSRWSGNSSGNQAQAETTSYLKGNDKISHRNYTRVRVVNSFFPSNIIEDSERQWGDRTSSATSSRKSMYYEVDFAMRSYWGDSTT